MRATDVLYGPFLDEWTTPLVGSTAAELAHAVARNGDETLGRWHQELATAVNELHRDRIRTESDPKVDGLDGAWGVGDPIVALARAVASLARRHPNARSATAGLLVDHLGSVAPDQSSCAS